MVSGGNARAQTAKVAADTPNAKESTMTIAERFLVAWLVALAVIALAATSHDTMSLARLL
jgi:hypothetical protein